MCVHAHAHPFIERQGRQALVPDEALLPKCKDNEHVHTCWTLEHVAGVLCVPHTVLKVKEGLCPWSPASDRKQSSGTGIHSERVPGWPGGSAQPAVHECSSLQMCQIRESSDDWTENSRLYKAFWCLSLPVVKASCFLVHVCIPFTLGAPRHR